MIASRRAYAIIFLLVVAFILYGSLYPFQFHPRAGSALAWLLHTRGEWDHYADLTSNILLYLPFGFFGVAMCRPRVLPIILAGAVLASGLELAQYYDQGRVTSMGDVYADTLGAALGALLATMAGAGLRWPWVRELVSAPAAALVLLMWFGYRLYPYVPVTTPRKYLHAFAPFVCGPWAAPWVFARFVIAWSCVAAIIAAVYGPRRFRVVFPLLVTAEFAGRILIIGNTLQPEDVMGAVAAFLLWLLLRPSWLPIATAIAFVTLLALVRLAPFTFTAPPHAFGWIPFASVMRGSPGVAIQAFCEKFFQYGGTIWLLRRAGLRTAFATAITAAVLFATGWAERYLPGRSAEITDAAMALVIGGSFALLREPSPHTHHVPRSVGGAEHASHPSV